MARYVEIDNRKIGAGYKPYVIAELSANHNGSLERALRTIDAAARSGADAIKLQTYTADTMTIDCEHQDFIIQGGLWDGYKLYELYKWAQTPYEWHNAMFEHARRVGLTVFSTPFDETAVDLLEHLHAPAYKVASFEILDLPLIRYIACKGKPMIMSTGMAQLDEVGDAIEAARSAGCRDIILLHCISSYPTPIEQSNLRQMRVLKKEFGVNVGLSDHTLGTTAAIASVALGACVIEKHFTLSRQDKGADSEFSIEPEEFRKLCQATEDVWLALGIEEYIRPKLEERNLVFRRSLYFVRDLPAGSVVTQADVKRIRPGFGLAPKHFEEVLGKRVLFDVTKGTPVSWDVLQGS